MAIPGDAASALTKPAESLFELTKPSDLVLAPILEATQVVDVPLKEQEQTLELNLDHFTHSLRKFNLDKIPYPWKCRILQDVAKLIDLHPSLVQTKYLFDKVFLHNDLEKVTAEDFLAALRVPKIAEDKNPKKEDQLNQEAKGESISIPQQLADFAFHLFFGKSLDCFSIDNQGRIKTGRPPVGISKDLADRYDIYLNQTSQFLSILRYSWAKQISAKDVVMALNTSTQSHQGVDVSKKDKLVVEPISPVFTPKVLPEIKVVRLQQEIQPDGSTEVKQTPEVLKGPATLFGMPGPTANTGIESAPNWSTIPTASGCTLEAKEIINQEQYFKKSGFPARVVILRDLKEAALMAEKFNAVFYVLTREQMAELDLPKLDATVTPLYGMGGEFAARFVARIDDKNEVVGYWLPADSKCGTASADEAQRLVTTLVQSAQAETPKKVEAKLDPFEGTGTSSPISQPTETSPLKTVVSSDQQVGIASAVLSVPKHGM